MTDDFSLAALRCYRQAGREGDRVCLREEINVMAAVVGRGSCLGERLRDQPTRYDPW